MRPYKTVKHASRIEFTLNKSRFIGRCFPLNSEEEALRLLADIKKEHWDATHNCYAYALGPGFETARFSDDGEPGGTAGLPMLEVLKSRGVTDALAVATRYFGGVLLGAGGLVRAYSRTASEAVCAAGIVHMRPARRVEIRLDYARYGAVEGYVRQNAGEVHCEFAENVGVSALVRQERVETFFKEIAERTDGRALLTLLGEAYLREEEQGD
ncbi:MAG: YigZ family protein [Clostridiaceae bacterium]|nr:YigZ family protein [Eubacteriales bacterium]